MGTSRVTPVHAHLLLERCGFMTRLLLRRPTPKKIAYLGETVTAVTRARWRIPVHLTSHVYILVALSLRVDTP